MVKEMKKWNEMQINNSLEFKKKTIKQFVT